MSDNGDESRPNKTVFRPSPLQGLRGAGQPPGPPPATGTVFTPAEPAAAPRAPQPAGPVPVRAAVADDDIPQPSQALRPRNAMMFTAAPVLALIAGVRSGRVQISMPDLHQKTSAALAEFDQALASAGYNTEVRQRARYAVAATIDDIAQNLPGQAADGAEWARRSLVVQAFNENIGGDRFWRLLEEMLAQPAQYADLIELYHACLAVGFEGRFRVTPDGKSRLHEIMTSAYAALQHSRTLSQTELSPRWKGVPTPPQKVSFWATLALAAGVALAVLLVIFILLRIILMQTGHPSLQALRAINPGEPLRMSRVAPAPPVATSTQLQRIQAFLAPEIAQHLVAVQQDAQSIRVRTTVGQLFQSGSDALESGRNTLFERIAAAVQPERGGVRVEGHADSDRVASLAFPDNVSLSKARAETVAQIVRSKLTDPKRVTSEGFGDSQPIASNATASGKALNRRVEIVIPRGE
jgi:type VI secretion system peptidoglycan-associated protein